MGGKTAVNHQLGKNMIGAFYQPEAVIIDINTLQTLPDREFISGISEIIKYGLIRDASYFAWLEQHIDSLLKRDKETLIKCIYKSCANKADIVAADEKEDNIRATLNLGHTFGHAIETGFGYGTWLHGEAVSTGILMATKLSYYHGWIDESLMKRIERLITKAQLPTTLNNQYSIQEVGKTNYKKYLEKFTISEFLELMSKDKKVANGKLNLVLFQGELGNAIITDQFHKDLLLKVLKEYGLD